MSYAFKIEGFAELQDRLAKMGDAVAAKRIVGAAYKTNQQFVDAIRDQIAANGSVDTGLLRDSIQRKKLVYDREGNVVILTGVSKSVAGTDANGNPRVPWKYAHIVDAKKPFLKPAFESAKQSVLDEFIIYLLKAVKRFEK
jgi:hypothetical protein